MSGEGVKDKICQTSKKITAVTDDGVQNGSEHVNRGTLQNSS